MRKARQKPSVFLLIKQEEGSPPRECAARHGAFRRLPSPSCSVGCVCGLWAERHRCSVTRLGSARRPARRLDSAARRGSAACRRRLLRSAAPRGDSAQLGGSARLPASAARGLGGAAFAPSAPIAPSAPSGLSAPSAPSARANPEPLFFYDQHRKRFAIERQENASELRSGGQPRPRGLR